MFLIFDVETNGKPKNYKAKMKDVDNWPRVTQLAYMVCNAQGEVIAQAQSLVKPDGWTIPKEEFFIENSMSTERCEEHGQPINVLLDRFIECSKLCDYIVAHNMAFDYNVLGAEMVRYKKSTGRKLTQLCTMASSTDYCMLQGPYGFKWPKLEELQMTLFDEVMDNAHDAMGDVIACSKCFFELLKLGVIKI